MRGRAELLLRDVAGGRASPERVVQGLDSIIGGSARLIEMLDLLLDLSKIEAGGLDLHPLVGDLAPLLKELAESVTALSDRHTLQLDVPAALIGVWDLRRLRQVFQNLLSNALKYSPDGGVITLRAELHARAVHVSVSDQGLGLPAEELPRLFDRFYRVEGTRRLEGSGLGLYICQAIVAAHGGHIVARSDGLGKGSTFEVALPLAATGQRECRSHQT
jgi:signal transduction histidine kinase